MCLTGDKEKLKVEIAQEDIVCYKVMKKQDDILTSPYQNMHYECGKMYVSETPMIIKHKQGLLKAYIEEGFHSFLNKKDAQDFASTLQICLWPSKHPYVVVKCLIPAGTRYAAGFFFAFGKCFDSFCSERIIAMEEV